MIRSFADKRTTAIFMEQPARSVSDALARAAKRKLNLLHAAARVDDLASPPGSRLEKLKGNRAGQWSIRVNDQWRICFGWDGTDAVDVELADYH